MSCTMESWILRAVGMRRTILVLALVASLAGCGESEDEARDPATTEDSATQDPAAVKKQDAQAKSDVRNLASGIEVCFIDQQDYSVCKEPEGTGVQIGSGKGQVEVADASAEGYTIIGHSQSGNTFTLKKSIDGSAERTCSAAGSTEGGCAGGKW